MSATVIGVGAMSSIGLGAAATAAAQRAGIAGHAAHPFMVDRAGEAMVVSRVPWGEYDMDGVARLVELALPAAREALAAAPRDRRIDLLLALPEARPGLPDGYPASVIAPLTEQLSSIMALDKVQVKPGGPAAGLALFGEASVMLTGDPERLVLVGGVDTWLVPETLEWIDSLEALHSPVLPWGFCPGEAAGFCLLGGERVGQGRLTIVGSGEAVEINRIRTETVCTGTGLTAAWRAALARLGGTAYRVDRLWCDLNGEPYRGDELAFCVLRTREHLADDVDVVTPADCWGDIGAATGPLLVMAAAFAAAKAYAPGPLSLASASSDGGGRAAVLLFDRSGAGAPAGR